MEEVWKDIPEYEGLYQVSNLGGVKSLARQKGWGKTTRWCEDMIMRHNTDKDGYKTVGLSKNKIRKTRRIHRLVAQAFIPNPLKLPCINHKDEVKHNNLYLNLEWCTVKYNSNYGTARLRASKNMPKNTSDSKKVYQYDLKGNFIKEWPSTREAHRNGFKSGSISCCCNKKPKYLTHKGFKWSYKKLH